MRIDTPIEDEKIIRKFQAGDIPVFDILVNKYKDRIFGLCYHFLSNYEDANECAQDIFVNAYKALGKFQFKSKFYTWLYRIAVNTCKRRLKSFKFRFWRKVVHIDKSESNDRTDILRIETAAEDKLINNEEDQQVRDAINSLPDKMKQIIILRDIEGLPYQEIETITGYNQGTVKSKLHRARAALKEKLKGIY